MYGSDGEFIWPLNGLKNTHCSGHEGGQTVRHSLQLKTAVDESSSSLVSVHNHMFYVNPGYNTVSLLAELPLHNIFQKLFFHPLMATFLCRMHGLNIF